VANELAHFRRAIERAEHFLFLYRLVSDTRKRKVRSDWTGSFRKFMRWKSDTRVTRIDGEFGMLIIRDGPIELAPEKFQHDYASELLRAAVVSAVSALDKYFHDKTLNRSFSILNGPE
jgi:hypothetical protein